MAALDRPDQLLREPGVENNDLVKNLLTGPWLNLRAPDGRVLEGIHGRRGAAGDLGAGAVMGADLIEMEPGNCFELHSHPGAHVLYVIGGQGSIEIDGQTYAIGEGDSIFVSADLAHGVACDLESGGPLRFVSIGFPHRDLATPDRMRLEQRGGG
jgi:quercetin dioxygenase-like cupin family protein